VIQQGAQAIEGGTVGAAQVNDIARRAYAIARVLWENAGILPTAAAK